MPDPGNKKVSALSAATALTGAEMLYVVQGGTSKQVAFGGNLAALKAEANPPGEIGLALLDDTTEAAARATISAQESSANLTTLADVSPGSAGLALLADVTTENVRDYMDLPVWSPDYGTPDLAAAAAFAAGRPLYLIGTTDAVLTLDITANGGATDATRFAYFKSALDWQADCKWAGSGRVVIRIAEGLHSMEGCFQRYGWQAPLVLTSASIDTRIISAISFAATGTANLYTMTITVTVALPAYVVAGYALGLQNVKGDNSAEACTGAVTVASVAGDRLSFTADAWFIKGAPVNPATINSDSHATSADPYDLDRSRIIIPNGCLKVSPGASDWNGSTELKEGFVNLYRGGRMYTANLGIAYGGSAGTAHDLIMIVDSASYLEDRTNSVFAGGGDNVIRKVFGGQTYLNRTCIGGAGTANAGVYQQARCVYDGFRVSLGGFKTYGLLAHQASYVNGTGVVSSCLYGIGVVDGGIATIESMTITECTNALYNEGGKIYGAAGTLLRRSTNDMVRRRGGRNFGAFTRTSITNSSVADSQSGNGSWSSDDSTTPRPTTLAIRNDGGSASLVMEGDTSATIQPNRYSADASAPSLDFRKGRGTRSSAGAVVTNDIVAQIIGRGHDGASAFQTAATINMTVIEATPSATAMAGRIIFSTTQAGVLTTSEVGRFDHATGFSMYGANPVIDANRHHRLRSYTVATLPSASPAAMVIYVSDGTTDKRLAVSDATNWRWPDGAVVS